MKCEFTRDNLIPRTLVLIWLVWGCIISLVELPTDLSGSNMVYNAIVTILHMLWYGATIFGFIMLIVWTCVAFSDNRATIADWINKKLGLYND